MPTAQEIVDTMKSALANSPGLSEVAVDGLRGKIDIKQLPFWERRAAREASPKTRPIASSIDLSGG